MSPIRMGRAKVATVTARELGTRTAALSMALLAGADELDAELVQQARRAVDKAVERSGIVGEFTVVALAGATGSGKSSLFNELVGAEVATIGARRPTTAKPAAAVWGDGDASELLDWLGVDARHGVESADAADDGQVDGDRGAGDRGAGDRGPGEAAREGAAGGEGKDGGRGGRVRGRDDQLAGSLDGLVLLDLPDFDSRELAHRREAERVLDLVDVFVWVTDPQKYADAKLHDEFVSLMSHHDAVTLAVLNQVDRLPTGAATTIAADLARLLDADGVRDAKVLTTSAVTGEGVVDLKQRLANAVAGHAASRQRLKSDVVGVASRLRRDVGDSEPVVADLRRADLDAALARAAGVPIVLDAVARDYRREAAARTEFLFVRWTRAFRVAPLRRLGLERGGGRAPISVDIEGSDVRAVLGRSSIPAPSASTVSAVDLATRTFVRDASQELPVRWQLALEDAVAGGEGDLSDALDRAMLGISLRARRPIWWFVLDVLQWACGLAALAGLAWYVVLWAMGLLALPRPDTPTVWVLPLPLVLLAGGLLAGLALGALGRWWSRVGARHRRAVIGRRLGEAVAAVADEQVLIPVDLLLVRHRETREQLDIAAA